ncbi:MULTISPECIES: GAF and ANTAR domain-containing protein [Actinosynnema]|uniref:GAF and ANTAR domain-containing protein n=1 Tax=Actinosynnema TaxID=40566 RepID=UPI0020A262CE|nr:GAF and ANTAR domain-containing protein [Actinosynnema pretiosum]MCP2094589.1 GAF domain-containing protein [Actinosynnema pretiosum]
MLRDGGGLLPEEGTELLLKQLDGVTRALLDVRTAAEALGKVVDAATQVIPGADLASITLRGPDGSFSSPVETDPVATALDRAQYRDGVGPCVDTARPDGPGYAESGDLRTESRWPGFAAEAVRHGYHCVLATELLPSEGGVSGALNVYSREPGALTADDRHVALLLATHASLALAHAHTAEVADLRQAQLRRAVDSRDVIGQAKGILMTRRGISADEAFALLRRTSQELNVKLVDLARTLADRHDQLDRG